MLKIIISGCNGRMGKTLSSLCAAAEDAEAVAGFDMFTQRNFDYPVFAEPFEFQGAADVVVDFSNPTALDRLLAYCRKRRLPLVLCTTGLSEEQLSEVREASKEIAVLRSGNMSLGINLLLDLIKKAAAVLDGYDIEIIEKHHNQKLDAPSGTAMMLYEAAASTRGGCEPVFERQSVRQKRGASEIGISSVRGGTIVGEHEVMFAGRDEVITISHSAYSREVFATGAFSAARFLKGKPAGMYSMDDVVK